MATVPTTLVLTSKNPTVFDAEMVFMLAKTVFRYGVKSVTIKNDKVYVGLTYSPKMTSLKRKFRGAPIKYLRSTLETEAEFALLEKALNLYPFGWNEDDDEEEEERNRNSAEQVKQNDKEEEEERNRNNKILEQMKRKAAATPPPPSSPAIKKKKIKLPPQNQEDFEPESQM